MLFSDEEKLYASHQNYKFLVDLMWSALETRLVSPGGLKNACAFAYLRYVRRHPLKIFIRRPDEPNPNLPIGGYSDDDRL